MRFEGKVVVVTGASAGVGRATVRAFAREGAHVGLIARNAERREAAVREAEACGVRACAVPADGDDATQVEAAAQRIERKLGPGELYVGFPTWLAIVGSKWAPSFLDWYLGRRGVAAQQRRKPEDPARPNDLWETVPGNYAAHGPFDDRARSASRQFRLRRRLGAYLAVAAIVWALVWSLRAIGVPGG